jgi:uncharacterized protein
LSRIFYDRTLMNDPALLPFVVLLMAITSLWLADTPLVWNSLFFVAVALAMAFHLMSAAGLPVVAAAAASIYIYYRVPLPRSTSIAVGFLMCLLILGLYGHFFPGFGEKTLFSNVVLSAGAYPTSLILNIDKPLAGLLLLGWGLAPLRPKPEWKQILPTALALSFLCVALMSSGAYALHAIQWAPKWRTATALFGFSNLFLVCIPEEVFFRGFVQRHLKEFFARRGVGPAWSVGIAASVFGLCHFVGGIGLILVATIAGFFYGAAYERTGRIEAPILVHFLLNFTHFALFTYPALIPH